MVRSEPTSFASSLRICVSSASISDDGFVGIQHATKSRGGLRGRTTSLSEAELHLSSMLNAAEVEHLRQVLEELEQFCADNNR